MVYYIAISIHRDTVTIDTLKMQYGERSRVMTIWLAALK